jgi:hypothetical protein
MSRRRTKNEFDDADARQSWLGELDRRANEVLADDAKLKDWAAVRQRIEAQLTHPVTHDFARRHNF